jgi:hypothetical protein
VNAYRDMQERQVARIIGVLLRPGQRPLTQVQLARMASSKKVPVSAAHIRALTPLLEREAQKVGRYYNRPIYGSYRVSVSKLPLAAARSMVSRWRNVVSRARNDAELGATLAMLTRCGDREIERIAQRFYDTYLDLVSVHHRLATDIDDLVQELDRLLSGK